MTFRIKKHETILVMRKRGVIINKKDENYVYYLIGQNLKKIRKEKHLSIIKLSHLSNYSEGFIKNIESSSYLQTFSLGTLWRFADVIGVDIKRFFDDLDE